MSKNSRDLEVKSAESKHLFASGDRVRIRRSLLENPRKPAKKGGGGRTTVVIEEQYMFMTEVGGTSLVETINRTFFATGGSEFVVARVINIPPDQCSCHKRSHEDGKCPFGAKSRRSLADHPQMVVIKMLGNDDWEDEWSGYFFEPA